tara:strand:- start:2748 stop:4907 length:2160 start_codon:yes stop_codon:yes gene_type:complete
MKFKDFIVKKTFVEMDSTFISTVEDWLRENPGGLPFKHLFKDDDTFRLLIPFQSKKKIAFKKQLEEMGYDVDFDRGMVSKEVETQRGKTRREQKIGKMLQRSKAFDKETLDWWSTFAGQTDSKEDQYAIIVSRHPIDVLRMSDHSGLESCHSQGNSYFQCAVSEAKGGGGIAYLVDAEDIEGWGEEELQEDEIFDDRDRHHGRSRAGMIQPLARVRLRLFTHKEDDYDLAVPESGSYGDRVEGFNASVNDWALSVQQNVLKGKRPSMKEFARYGGSYQDSNDGALFNQLFGDKEDGYGNTDYEGEDDYAGQYEQYQEEAQGFHDAYNFDHDEVSADFDVHDDGEGAYCSFSGTVIVRFPNTAWKKEPPDGHSHAYRHWGRKDDKTPEEKKKQMESWEEAIIQMYNANDLHGEHNMWVHYQEDNIELHFSIDSEEPWGHPDDYDSFLGGTMTDIDNDYGGFVVKCKDVLQELGWLGETEMDKWMVETDKLFKNFEWDWDESSYTMDVDTPYQMIGDLKDIENPRDNSSEHPERSPSGPMSWRISKWQQMRNIQSNHPGFREFYEVFIREIMKYVSRIRQQDKRQLPLPGMKMTRQDMARPNPLPATSPMAIKPRIEWNIDYDRNVYMRLRWELPMGNAATEKTLTFLKWLDKNWDWAVRSAGKIFTMTVKVKYGAHAKEIEAQYLRDKALSDRLEKGEIKFKIGEPRPAFGDDSGSTPTK